LQTFPSWQVPQFPPHWIPAHALGPSMQALIGMKPNSLSTPQVFPKKLQFTSMTTSNAQ
jgi:hypothetical protein